MSISDFIDSKFILVGAAIVIFYRYIRSESDHKIILKS
jgi:hypothetical protein